MLEAVGPSLGIGSTSSIACLRFFGAAAIGADMVQESGSFALFACEGVTSVKALDERIAGDPLPW